jgi:hypothetical protein
MKTSDDSVKECIAKVIFIRNKRHLSTFLNTKASVNPTAFYGLKLLEVTDPVFLVLRHVSLFMLLLVFSSVLRAKHRSVLK